LAILAIHRAGILFLALWLGAVIAWLGTRGQDKPPQPDIGRELRGVLIRFAVLAPLVTVATWLVFPDLFLSLPRDRPVFWAIIMVLYPLLSVWPQEMLYRSLLFHRYAAIFRNDAARIAASALAFGFAHVIFLNWIAIAMTAAGGFLFARDYARHRSLRVTCIEHSLYGCLIFTVGLGRFFYTGAAWHH
jgi:membrane protease YdiL (CAAX protease family)